MPEEDKPLRFMVCFKQPDAHSIRVYLNTYTFVPVRWNHKDSEERKIIYEFPAHLRQDFVRIIRTLVEDQGRDIKVSKVRDVFCDRCGVIYQYRKDNRTGTKVCAECGGTEFIN